MPPIFTNYLKFNFDLTWQNTYAFWEDVHPSSKAHAILSSQLKTEFFDLYFDIVPPNHKCSYVEVENKGCYVLDVSSNGNSVCGSGKGSLLKGERRLFTVEAGSSLTLKARLGRSKTLVIRIPFNYPTKYCLLSEKHKLILQFLN